MGWWYWESLPPYYWASLLPYIWSDNAETFKLPICARAGLSLAHPRTMMPWWGQQRESAVSNKRSSNRLVSSPIIKCLTWPPARARWRSG